VEVVVLGEGDDPPLPGKEEKFPDQNFVLLLTGELNARSSETGNKTAS